MLYFMHGWCYILFVVVLHEINVILLLLIHKMHLLMEYIRKHIFLFSVYIYGRLCRNVETKTYFLVFVNWFYALLCIHDMLAR